MRKILNYKSLLNSFVDKSQSYSLDIKNRLTNLFLYYNMGCVEEVMLSRQFNNGLFGATNSNLVGIPKEIISRISSYYTQLKSDISGETTTIQTQLNLVSPRDSEKEYIKSVLNEYADQQLTNINSELLNLINSFRTQQTQLSSDIDRLNFIVTNSYDGQYLNKNGGRVVALQLTSTTVVTDLTNNYNVSNTYLNDYITNYVTNMFPKNYPGTNEYIFFSNIIYTNDVMSFNFSGNYRTHLTKLLQYRNDTLYNKLLKIESNGVNGLTYKTQNKFKPKLNNIVIEWVRYDVSLMYSRFTEGINFGYNIFNGEMNKYYNDFDIGYTVNSGFTAQNLIINNLRSMNIGNADTSFNYKTMQQLYIS